MILWFKTPSEEKELKARFIRPSKTDCYTVKVQDSPMTRYSETVMDHFQYPRNQGKLDHPDLIGVAGVPGRGRYVILQLALSDARNRVTAARFQSHGCGSTIASASILTELVSGFTLAECRQLTAERLLSALGGLPPDKQDCADFALAALRNAIDSTLSSLPVSDKQHSPAPQ